MAGSKRTKEEIDADLAECQKVASRAAAVDDWQVVADMVEWEIELKAELASSEDLRID